VEPEAVLPVLVDATDPGPAPDAAPIEEAPTSPAIPLAALTAGPAFDDGDDDPDADWGDSDAPALPLQPVPTSTEPDPTRKVTPVRRTLRSGHRVRAPGDVIVYGDVNAGALVEAGGNIIVLGALRGLAHAGVSGARDAVVLAFDLRPAQVRIADTIAFPEGSDPARARSSLLTLLDRARGAEPARGGGPEVARLVGGAIVIEPFRGRFPG
jgi:septum site-determining protein MinC